MPEPDAAGYIQIGSFSFKNLISSFLIDQGNGGLTLQGSGSSADAPTFLATDRTGRYLLSAYYQGGYAVVHPLGADGAVSAPPLDRHETATGAHAIATDPSNRFAFVPHIARLSDNVLEPPLKYMTNLLSGDALAYYPTGYWYGKLHQLW